MFINSNLLLLGILLLSGVEGAPIEPNSADMVGSLDELFAAADEIAHEELDEIEYGALLPDKSRNTEFKSKLYEDEYDKDLISLKRNLASSENINIKDGEKLISEIKEKPNYNSSIDKKPGKSLMDALKGSNPSSSKRDASIEEDYNALLPDEAKSDRKTSKIKEDGDSTLYKKERPDKHSQSLDDVNYDYSPSHKSDSIARPKISSHHDDIDKSSSKKDSEYKLAKNAKDPKDETIPKGEIKKPKSNSDFLKSIKKSELPTESSKEPVDHAEDSEKETGEVDYVKQLEELTHVANNFIESKDFKSIASDMLKEKVDKLINEKGEAYLDIAKEKLDSYVPTIVEDVQKNIEDLEIGAAAGVAAKYMNLF